jgi:RNA polymerase subunit RPABC4/transcription elongation factor Spt4
METENEETEEYRCSECNAIVKLEDSVCPICGADLGETVEDDIGDVVLLKIFQSDFEAQAAKAQLDEAGIMCLLSGDNEGGMAPHLSLTKGIRMLVNEIDLESAIEVLKAMEMY